jgi:hypothetical protein
MRLLRLRCDRRSRQAFSRLGLVISVVLAELRSHCRKTGSLCLPKKAVEQERTQHCQSEEMQGAR